MLGDREAWTQKLDWEHSAEFNKDFGRLSETRNSKPYARNAKPYFQALGSIFCRASLQRCQVLNLNSETVGLALKLNEDNNRSCMLSREVKARFGRRVWQGRAGQGRAGQGRAGQGRAGQGRTGQDSRAAQKPNTSRAWKSPKRPNCPGKAPRDQQAHPVNPTKGSRRTARNQIKPLHPNPIRLL